MNSRKPLAYCLLALAPILASCATGPAQPRIDNIPMYGQPQIPRPEPWLRADEGFIQKAAAGHGGDRAAASRAWWAQGEQFFREQNFDYAMRRYNQAWLLDPAHYRPHWGFARVLVQTDRPAEALPHFETALRLCKDDYQKVALLSDAGVAHSESGDFRRANELFKESTALDASYANAWYRWSESFYREGKYPEAWNALEKARSLGAAIPEPFERALSQEIHPR